MKNKFKSIKESISKLPTEKQFKVMCALIFTPILIAAIIVGWYIYKISAESRANQFKNTQQMAVSIAAEAVKEELEFAIKDVKILAEDHHLKNLIDVSGNINEMEKTNLEEHIVIREGITDKYEHIYIVGKDGMEITRVDNDESGTSIAPEIELRSRSNQYFFKKAIELEPGNSAFSIVNPEVEEEHSDSNIKLAMSFTDNNGKKAGIVVLYYRDSRILNELYKVDENIDNQSMMLVNNQGYWIMEPEVAGKSGFMYPTRQYVFFAQQYPKVWKEIKNGNIGAIESRDGIFAYETVYPALIGNNGNETKIEHSWKIVSMVPSSIIKEANKAYIFKLVFVEIVLLLLSFILIMTAVRARLTKAIYVAELKREYEFISDIIESLPHPFCVVNANDYSIKVDNTAAKKIFDVIGYKYSDKSYENMDMQSEFIRYIEQVKTTKKSDEIDQLRTDTHGNKIYYETHLYPIFNNENNVSEIIVYSFDITERKKTEEKQLCLFTAIEQSPLMKVLTDTEGNIEYANNQFTKDTGYRVEAVKGKSTRILKSGAMSPEEYKILWGKISAGKTWEGEFYNRRKDGTLYWERALITPIKNASGEIIRYLKIGEDVTDLKWLNESLEKARTEIEVSNKLLKESEAKLLEAQEIAKLGRWELDIATGFLSWSESAYDVFEVDKSEKELTYDYFISAVHPDDRAIVDYAYTNSLKNRTPYEITHRLLMNDGRIKWVIEKCNTYYDEQGKPLRSVGTMQDISALKEVEEQLRLETLRANEMKALAEKANAAKSAFLANMSHEIRTPMNAIIGFSQLAITENSVSRKHDFISKINYSAHALLRIINDILDFSKIEAGKLEIETIELDIYNLLSDIFEQANIKSNRKGIGLLLRIDDDMPAKIFGDPLRITQVLTNLVDNAIKFTERGEVEIRASRLENGYGEYLEFSVRDTGVGIAGEQLKKLFNPFAQVDKSIARNYGGTGLGLAICKQLTELMGGEIRVDSKTGKGSVFTMAIPYIKALQSYEQIKQGFDICAEDGMDINARLKGLKVLLAEDNAINQEVAAEILKRSGMAVDIAQNGKEAVEAVRSNEYDIILMDIQMPIMNGYEAASEIRKNQTNCKLPIIAMTAEAMPSDIEECMKSGMDAHVSKPIDVSRLLGTIAAYVNKSQDFRTDEEFDSKQNGMKSNQNLNVEEAISRLGGNQKLYRKLIRIFHDSSENVIEEIQKMIFSGNVGAVETVAHTLKGTAGNIGAQNVYVAAANFESEIRANGLGCAKELLEPLNAALKEALNSIADFIKNDCPIEIQPCNLSPEMLKPKLAELEYLLKSSDISAVELSDEFVCFKGNTLLEDRLREMKALIDEFDYDKALLIVNEINKILSEE